MTSVAPVEGRVLRYVPGLELSPEVDSALAEGAAGVSLYRHVNDGPPERVRAFTDAIHAAAARGGWGPALVAVDQEGGQLIGLGTGTTQFAGSMALGATDDVQLTERVGRAIGRELRALGVTVDYAPVCDLASNPANPALGIRTFGSEPEAVGKHAGALVRGLQSAGVAAALKHFPGLGDAGTNSHFVLPVVDRSRTEIEDVSLAPFRAAIAAGARLVMSAHVALPALTGSGSLPATLSRAVLHGVLRDELGFAGVSITDALDMAALVQGPEQGIDVVAAISAGIDLLLCGPDEAASARVVAALRHAATRDLFEPDAVARAAGRIAELRTWLARFEPPELQVVGCVEHRALAAELARRSITLVRDDPGLLPLRPAADDRIVVVEPRPRDLTPADTSSYEPAGGLARTIRSRHAGVEGVVLDPNARPPDTGAILDRARSADLLVVGTISAALDPGQAAFVRALLELDVPTVVVALRTPWDLTAYPTAATYLCTYGILPASLEALAAGLWGDAPVTGRLPVSIGDRYRPGHGLERQPA